jgi:hypothetical protein
MFRVDVAFITAIVSHPAEVPNSRIRPYNKMTKKNRLTEELHYQRHCNVNSIFNNPAVSCANRCYTQNIVRHQSKTGLGKIEKLLLVRILF